MLKKHSKSFSLIDCISVGVGGLRRKAEVEFQKIIDHPGIVGNYPLGALAHLGLAESLVPHAERAISTDCKMGAEKFSGNGALRAENLTKAKSAYRDFLAIWRNADPDTPILKQARPEFLKLER